VKFTICAISTGRLMPRSAIPRMIIVFSPQEKFESGPEPDRYARVVAEIPSSRFWVPGSRFSSP
jgi:hypothetical protein